MSDRTDRYVDERMKQGERGGDVIKGVLAVVGFTLFILFMAALCRLTGG